jgi:hypothetical protein
VRNATPLSFSVIKFIQPSLCRIPLPDADFLWNYREPEEVAMREVEFYDKVVHLQGDVIPYLLGSQKVCIVSLNPR